MQRAFHFLIVLASLAVSSRLRAAEGFEKWERDIAAFEASDRREMPPKGAILFVGSSSIRLWTNLAKAFPEKRIIQRGFGGSTMADALHFADRIVLPYEPKQIVVYEGDNDLANGKSPEAVAAEFKSLVEKVHTALPKTKIWFIAVKPSPSRWKLEAQQRALNEEIDRWSKSQRRVGYIDIWKPMLGADGKPRPELFVADNLHLNAVGYEIWRRIIAKKI